VKKTDQNKLAKILAGLAKFNGTEVTPEEIQEQIKPLYSQESQMYIGQAILNFFAARIQPRLEKGESETAFDKRYREWRIKNCKLCKEEFAYAWSFDGVSYCSHECLEASLKEIGITMQRDRDLKLRYGPYSHPAIVPSAALAVLKDQYSEVASGAFD
jgi:hypothetical protein